MNTLREPLCHAAHQADTERRNSAVQLTRREAIKSAASLLGAGVFSGELRAAPASVVEKSHNPNTASSALTPAAQSRLRVATCQFPVGAHPSENARHIRGFMRKAAGAGAHLLHTCEAALTGYPGDDMSSFEGYDWSLLRKETARLRQMARELKIWLVLGSAHFLDEQTKPTNCLYLINPDGDIADRYDKCFLTGFEKAADVPLNAFGPNQYFSKASFPTYDCAHYSPGDRLVTRDINGVTIGLAICYDVAWPQIYIAYRELGATVILHSFYNARMTLQGLSFLQNYVMRAAATRCADNRVWAVCNNSSQSSAWASFIARPDSTIPKQLPINQPGMLIHDFPDGCVDPHNYRPMRKRDDEMMHVGTPPDHPRRLNGQAEV